MERDKDLAEFPVETVHDFRHSHRQDLLSRRLILPAHELQIQTLRDGTSVKMHKIDISPVLTLHICEQIGIGRGSLPYKALGVITPDNLIFFFDCLCFLEFPILAEPRHFIEKHMFQLNSLAV